MAIGTQGARDLANEIRPSQARLLEEIRLAAELLPLQGPITAFAFLNPLQGLESLPFDDAMRKVKRIYGCEPYLDETRYLAKFQRGRITLEDLHAILSKDLGKDGEHCIAGLIRRHDFRLCLLTHSIHCGVDRELDWLLAESDALRRFRSDVSAAKLEVFREATREWVCLQQSTNSKYWDEKRWEGICLQSMWDIILREIGTAFHPEGHMRSIRHRDWVRSACNIDCDQWVHAPLVQYTAAFLDQGFAHWRLPQRDRGYFRTFCTIHQKSSLLTRRWARGLSGELNRIVTKGLSPLDSIEESLQILGVTQGERQEFLQATLLALRGFSGMIWQTEIRPDRVYVSSPEGTLVEYIAVRLILDRFALSYAARTHLAYQGPLSELKGFLEPRTNESTEVTAEQQAYILFQLSQISGWTPQQLAGLSREEWVELSTELSRFSSHERRRIYQAAFERQMLTQSLDAISLRTAEPPIRPHAPQLQIVCCIDAREESFRRHLEELDDEIETFGIAGFFGIPMYYRGAADAHFASLAPIVVIPKHWVQEEVVYSLEDVDRNRAKARRVIGSTSHRLHVGTRGSLGGAFVTTLLGPLATAPLLSRVLFPRLTGALHRTARQFVAPPVVTRLHLERSPADSPSDKEEGLGFTVSEMAKFCEQALRDIGLTSRFAKLVLFMGHGSSCLNNPHESAYHCGACSGSPGGPNARALAAMLNDSRVRRILQEKGISIPEETYFLGALHNTATEEIAFYDLELLPSSQISGLRRAREKFRQVAERNAHERCRRFESASLSLSGNEALLHVQGRTEDLAQTRPEYGNCTNALCFVGRRSRLRGLYLDRRAFLMSYDPTCDDDQRTSLARILSAVIPVCEGINSLYSFSAMDSSGWGSGTKLPHNVTSLLGVMDGAASDLRTGIPWQGLDIHEPLRLLFVIESKPEQLLAIIDANPTLARICRNVWSHLATLDPDSNTLHQFIGGEFVPYPCTKSNLPTSKSSFDWYSGHRDHLPFARIRKS